MNDPWDRRLGFWWIAEDFPEMPAILDSPDGPRTYAELAGDSHQLAHLWRALGAAAGDVVAVLADNGNTLVECALAAQESGLQFTPLNVHLTGHELRTIMDHSGCRVLVAGARFAPLLDGLVGSLPELRILTDGDVPGFQSLAAARESMPRTEPADRCPGSLFVYTSGTTGKPKGIRRPIPPGEPGRVANASAVFARAFDFRPFDGPMLVSTGMFHGGSYSYYMGGLNVGHGLVIMAKFDPERVLQLIEKYRVRTAYMVPTQFHRLLQLPPEVRERYDLSSLHAVVHSAAPCPRDVKEQMMAWWGPIIWETYGGMEGAATIAKPHRWIEKPGTVGRAVRGVRLTILDSEGKELPAGVVGEIFMENDVGFAYHDDPDETQRAFKGKRFSLGDLGYLDEDGYLFISGRAKDMIITGGTNVYPAEVEATLLAHPKVLDAGVIGVPDPDWGESIVAVVQLKPGIEATAEIEAELEDFCSGRLASYKRPRRWEFRATLPRTEAGKLYKRQIRDEYLKTIDSEELR
ncbi:MAG: AMP-binding protein [Ilumatobacteraceae bacterium]